MSKFCLYLLFILLLSACNSRTRPVETDRRGETGHRPVSTHATPTPIVGYITRTPSATPAATAVPATRTPRPSATPGPSRTPRPTNTPTATATPLPFGDEPPTDKQVILFLAESHSEIMDTEFTRQDVDLNGDGQPEILVNGGPVWALYVAILGRSGDVWQEWLYVENHNGKYDSQVRLDPQPERLVIDFLTRSGGTGLLVVTWEQHWVQCGAGHCDLVWSAPLFEVERWCNTSVDRKYAVAELEQPNPETIHLTTRHFGVLYLPIINPEIIAPASGSVRRVSGPDVLQVYRWDGAAFRLQSSQELTPAQIIERQFSALTPETTELLHETLQQISKKSGGWLDDEALSSVVDDFSGWEKANNWYGQPDAAAHNGRSDQLGEWLASLQGHQDFHVCRLTVQRHIANRFELFDRLELPCTLNFSRLAWADVTGDGRDELLLITMPPEEFTFDASLERLHVYALEDGLVELATLDGFINSADGLGIDWRDVDGDGRFELLVGLPLLDLEQRPTVWPELTRCFQVYVWDAESGAFAPGE